VKQSENDGRERCSKEGEVGVGDATVFGVSRTTFANERCSRKREREAVL
jgi:hypothetical protein